MNNVMIVYDSVYGNTRQIAQAIFQAVVAKTEAELLNIQETKTEYLISCGLLIIGSPTQKFSSMPAVKNVLNAIPAHGLQGVRAAVFDTRIALSDINSAVGRFFVGRFGYAAESMAKILVKKGAELIVPPEGFLVQGTEGPLKTDELVRAGEWGEKIIGLL